MLRRRITERGFQKAYSVVLFFLIFKQGLTMQPSLAWKSPYNKVDSNLWHFPFPLQCWYSWHVSNYMKESVNLCTQLESLLYNI